MRTASLLLVLSFAPATLVAQGNPNPVPRDPSQWPQHSMDRPRPPVVMPGPVGTSTPPSDAIVLFDGHGLEAWRSTNPTAGPAPWRVTRGYFEVAPGTGGIATRERFGDVQLHIEWSSPTEAGDSGQDRGNSGVFLMGRYEVQVLDSWENPTYADGQAGSIYGQFPPAVNPIRAPGEWNSYDIVFHRPRFDGQGRVTTPGRVTLFFNGVLVHDEQVIIGPTSHGRRSAYETHDGALPISLQDHGHKVRFRSVWVRRLEPTAP